MNREDWLRVQSRAHPRRPALVQGPEVVSFSRLDQEVDRLTAGLQTLGIRPGARVAFWRLPRQQAIRLVWAVARAGALLIPLHDRWSAYELEQALQRTQPHLVVSRQEGLPLSLPGVSWEALWEAGQNREPQRVPLHPLQGMVFTSGSTGGIKAAVLSWANHYWSAWASASRLGVLPHDAWLLQLPLYHVGGLAILWRCMLYGLPVVLPGDDGPFRGGAFQQLYHWPRRPTLVSLVPTMLYRLLEAGLRPWPELRVVLVGGAAASPELIRAALELGWPVALTYGLTEAASQVATAAPETVRRFPGTVGHPLPFLRVEIRDEQGRLLPAGQVGEIVVQGPTVFHGYWGDARATQQALRRGALYTGDEGYLDEDGRLWVRGRRAFCINTGGEKVYPEEVEAVLLERPEVAEVCVVGLPDPQWGEQVVAAVVWRPGVRGDLEGLQAHCRSRLAAYKCPRRWFVFQELPRRPSGKVDRRAVRRMILADYDVAGNAVGT